MPYGSTAPATAERRTTFTSLMRSMTNRDEQGPLRKEVLIPKYELDWSTLKAWLDTRFASYNYTFTERFNVVCVS